MEPSGKMSVCGKETDTIISTQNRKEKKKSKKLKKKMLHSATVISFYVYGVTVLI